MPRGTKAALPWLSQAPPLGLLSEVPWGHHLEILKKVAPFKARIYYLRATARFGWTRNVLLNQIKAGAIGVAEYQLRPRLPAELKGKLPTAKQLTNAVRSVLPASRKL